MWNVYAYQVLVTYQLILFGMYAYEALVAQPLG